MFLFTEMVFVFICSSLPFFVVFFFVVVGFFFVLFCFVSFVTETFFPSQFD